MTSALNASAVIFVDQTKASITEIKADKTTAVANGKDAIKYTVKVMKNGQPVKGYDVTFLTTAGNLSKTKELTDKDGYATVNLTSNAAGKAVVSAKVSDVNSEVKASEVEFFTELSINKNVEVLGTKASGELPDVWLQYGQIKLNVNGGNDKYSWSSSNPNIASIDASSGIITLKEKGEAVIKVVSGDKQTATYTISTPKKIVSVNSGSRVNYNSASSICGKINGSLPSSIAELETLYNKWGAANNYQHYTQSSITAWTLQTSDDVKKGVTSTYDLVRENPQLNKVNIDDNNAYAVCVK